MLDREKLKSQMNELKDLFEKRNCIKLAYLFGSFSTKKETKLSDIDFAFYLNETLDDAERSEIRLELIGELSSILKTDKIDVVIMNQAPYYLNYEIIKYGRLIYGDIDVKVDVESRVMDRYLDRKYYDDRASKYYLKRVAEKGLL